MHGIIFSWGVVLELVKTGRKPEAAGRREGIGTTAGDSRKLAGAALDSRYVSTAAVSISLERP
jgi:hypothetical protein